MTEEWRIIADFPDYAVSSEGRVRRVVPDRHGRVIVDMLTPVIGNHGYLVVTLHRDASQRTKTVHRLVCAAFHGQQPFPGWHAAHEDGNRLNNRDDNLHWASPSDNNMEKHQHGTMRTGANHHAIYNPACMPRGESHGNAKLTDETVRAIRDDPRKQSDIAAEYGVSQSLVSQVKRGTIWTHVTQEKGMQNV